jgi:putative ABC transport system permease protein
MREFWSRVRTVFRAKTLDDDLRAEIESHLQMEVDAGVERGLSPPEAASGARRRFGNRTAIREASGEAWRFHRLESVLQDMRYGLRVLRRSPGFTLIATIVIALGIGAVTSTFTLLDHVLLRPLPFSKPERLVLLHETNLAESGSRDLVSPPNFVDWRSSAKSFETMGAYLSANLPVNLSGQGTPVRLESTLVEVELFSTLGVRPAMGRTFTSEDGGPDGARVVVLSHALALTLFGSPSAAVGRTLSLDHQAHTVIGVMPPGFVFPRAETALWRPLRLTAAGLMANRSNHILFAIARLRVGVTLESARSEMEVIAGQLQRSYPKDNAKSGVGVIDLRDLMSPEARMLVIGVFGASLCLMLIACTNLASLLFARAVVRKPEMAIRVAAGAARGRLVRQLLTESLVLACMGGMLGSLLAIASTPLFARLAPNGLPIDGAPEVDLRVLAVAALVTLLTSILFGTGPALRSCRRPDLQALRTRSASGGNTDRLRAVLVLAEVAGCVILLVGTGLLLKALWRVQSVDPGFRPAGVLTMRTALPMPKYSQPDVRQAFYSRVLASVRALPGVTSAAYVSYHPMEPFSGRFQVLSPGVADDPLTAPGAFVHFVTPGYFATLGIPLRRGRVIDERDDASAPQVVVLSESLAERLWPGQDPIGRAVTVAGDRTVVGVVGDIVVRSLEGPRSLQVYFPAAQLGTTSTYYAPRDLLIRTSGDPSALGPVVDRIIRDVDPEQAVSTVRPLADIVSLGIAPRRDQLFVLATFAAIAFLLAAVGIHGLLSFTVSARTHEIGVRVALGAMRSTILRMFLRQGITLGIVGVAVGLPLAYLGARALGGLLFGVEPSDPRVYAPAALLALTLAVTGSLLPALRAAAIDPAMTTRSAD